MFLEKNTTGFSFGLFGPPGERVWVSLVEFSYVRICFVNVLSVLCRSITKATGNQRRISPMLVLQKFPELTFRLA